MSSEEVNVRTYVHIRLIRIYICTYVPSKVRMYIRVETNTREGQLFERTNIKHNIHKTLNINKLRITYMNIYQLYLPVLNSSVISFEGLNIKYVWIYRMRY